MNPHRRRRSDDEIPDDDNSVARFATKHPVGWGLASGCLILAFSLGTFGDDALLVQGAIAVGTALVNWWWWRPGGAMHRWLGR